MLGRVHLLRTLLRTFRRQYRPIVTYDFPTEPVHSPTCGGMEVIMLSRSPKLIRAREVCEKTGRGLTSLYGNVAGGTMPPQIKDGRSSLWIESEVDAVLAAEAAGIPECERRALVKALVAARKEIADKLREQALNPGAQLRSAGVDPVRML